MGSAQLVSLLLASQSQALCWRWHSGSLRWCRNISPDPLSASCPTQETTVLPSAITSSHLVSFPLPGWLHCPPCTSYNLHKTDTCYCLVLVNSATFPALLEPFHSFPKSQTLIQHLLAHCQFFIFLASKISFDLSSVIWPQSLSTVNSSLCKWKLPIHVHYVSHLSKNASVWKPSCYRIAIPYVPFSLGFPCQSQAIFLFWQYIHLFQKRK